MPIFEFVCEDCHREFEELVYCADDDVVCPACSSEHVAKVLSKFAFKSGSTFRGSSESHCGSHCGGCSSGACGGCHRH